MHLLKKHSLNIKGRDFICGDLHGMYDLLMKRLREVNFNYKKDRLFATGDLTDRGPQSYEVLRLLHEDWFFPNMGNHDAFILQNLWPLQEFNRIINPDSWFLHGGKWYIEYERKRPEGLPKNLLKKIAALPIIQTVEIKTGNINIVHAEFPLGWNQTHVDGCSEKIHQNDLASMLCGRNRIDGIQRRFSFLELHTFDQMLNKTYVGHSIVDEPTDIGKYRYVDTGAFRTGNLVLEEL